MKSTLLFIHLPNAVGSLIGADEAQVHQNATELSISGLYPPMQPVDRYAQATIIPTGFKHIFYFFYFTSLHFSEK